MDMSTLIRERRMAVGLTQQELGEKCGYSGQAAKKAVWRWEHAGAPVPLDRVRRLAAALMLPLDAFIP